MVFKCSETLLKLFSKLKGFSNHRNSFLDPLIKGIIPKRGAMPSTQEDLRSKILVQIVLVHYGRGKSMNNLRTMLNHIL